MRVFKQKEPLFSVSATEPQIRTSYNQQEAGTKEERTVLLYNNRWICLLPFARKPDPRRVSKQVSREPPQAWLFGLVRLAPQAERKAPQAEFSAPQASQFSAPQAGKIARSAAISLLFSLGFRSRCSRRAAPPAARCLQRTAERGRKLLHRSSVAFFSFLAAEGIGGRGHSAPRPRPQSSRPFAQAPVGGPSGAAPVGARRAPTGHF